MSWDQKTGKILREKVSEDEYWELFNYVFSDACRKTNTYKFGLIKAILDNIFNAAYDGMYWSISYRDIFSKFAENYWNLVVKYELRQMRNNGKSDYSYLEQIFMDAVEDDPVLNEIDFSSIEDKTRQKIIQNVSTKCRRNVIGALYSDLDGLVYSFDISKGSVMDGLLFSYEAFNFLTKYKMELEKLNYYSWAKYLETINDESVVVRLLEKLELATPKRNDLSVYREVLRKEFEEKTCFYCGKKLSSEIHVDHYIPWRFVKEDNLWNLVLSCSKCNLKKNSRLPAKATLDQIIQRNKKADYIMDGFVIEQFKNYDEAFLGRMWQYAKMSGYKELV